MSAISILVVDDDATLGRFVCTALRRAGYDVHSASGIERATEIAAERPLDLLLADVVLGTVDGLDVEEAVRRIRPRVKTLFMSGYARPRYKTGAEDPVLAKPFGADELLERVESVLAPV
jgi:DNA-binding response OmpR family regulator